MANLPTATLPHLLVTGASGFLGWHLCCRARSAWQVHGTFHRHPIEIEGVACRAIDLTNGLEIRQWLQALRPDAIIHTAALSKPNQCEQSPSLSHAINVEAAGVLAKFCQEEGVPFIFTSTEQVFDGQAAPYQESDIPTPLNVYGRHKLDAERLIAHICPTGIICRMPLMYGPPSPCADSFVQGFLRKLRARQPLHLFVDEYRSPVYVEDAVTGLLLALEKGSGILHLGGPERISRYEFGHVLARVFDLDPDCIVPAHQSDLPMAAARPADVTICNQRAVTLGYAPRDVKDGLVALKQILPDPIN